jgi:hypothetical protein
VPLLSATLPYVAPQGQGSCPIFPALLRALPHFIGDGGLLLKGLPPLYSPNVGEEVFSEVHIQDPVSSAPWWSRDPAWDGPPVLRVGLAEPTTQRRLLVADHEQVEEARRRPRVD